jgi:hypothetical protein
MMPCSMDNVWPKALCVILGGGPPSTDLSSTVLGISPRDTLVSVNSGGRVGGRLRPEELRTRLSPRAPSRTPAFDCCMRAARRAANHAPWRAPFVHFHPHESDSIGSGIASLDALVSIHSAGHVTGGTAHIVGWQAPSCVSSTRPIGLA